MLALQDLLNFIGCAFTYEPTKTPTLGLLAIVSTRNLVVHAPTQF